MNRVQELVIPFLVCLCLLGIGIVVADAVQDQTGTSLVSYVLPPNEEAPLTAAVEPAEVEEEIPIDALPDTGGMWHLSLFLNDDWEQRPDEVQVVRHFSTDCRLRRLREQTHTHIYTPSNPLYTHRYAKSIQRVPAIRLQQRDGKVIYQVGNAIAVPATAKKLGNDIARAIKERCPFPRPRPEPTPGPTPTPRPTPIPDMVPDVTPDTPDGEVIDEEEEDDGLSNGQIILVGMALLAVAAVGAALASAKKDALG